MRDAAQAAKEVLGGLAAVGAERATILGAAGRHAAYDGSGPDAAGIDGLLIFAL
jgi:hypothetical protein